MIDSSQHYVEKNSSIQSLDRRLLFLVTIVDCTIQLTLYLVLV